MSDDVQADSENRMMKLNALRRLEPIPESAIAEAEEDGTDVQRASIDQRLSWNYRYEAVSQISAKTSVTEMKKLLALQDSPSLDLLEERAVKRQSRESIDASTSFTLSLRRPKFMESTKLTPAEREPSIIPSCSICRFNGWKTLQNRQRRSKKPSVTLWKRRSSPVSRLPRWKQRRSAAFCLRP